MARTQVSIGRVKRDISDLANRVAYGGERFVLTPRGRPKAVIVSIEDYQIPYSPSPALSNDTREKKTIDIRPSACYTVG